MNPSAYLQPDCLPKSLDLYFILSKKVLEEIIVSVSSESFIVCNGYPNTFWGWGGEDNALLHRMETNKISIEKPKESVIDLEEIVIDDEIRDDKEIKKKDKVLRQKMKDLWKGDMKMDKDERKTKVNEDKEKWGSDGLSNVKDLYKIVDRKDTENVSHIKVYLTIDN